MRRPALLAAVLAFVAAVLLTTASPASAAPPGYGGPVATCPGTQLDPIPMYYGNSHQGTLRIWFTSANQGSYCAKVYDDMSGDHYMNVTIQRADWTTIMNDPGIFSTYAGGVQVFGVHNVQGRTICVKVRGVLQANGVNYTGARDIPCGAN